MTQESKSTPNSEKKLFRFHRGTLSESMKTVFEFRDRADLIEKILGHYKNIGIPRQNGGKDFECIPYGGIDKRIGWDTYLIKLDNYPVGMTNCAI